MRAFLFILFIFSAFVGGTQSPTNVSQLDDLDELAFVALESNDPNTIAKAQELLDAAKEANSSTHQINAYTILGIVNKNKGHYVSSVEFYNEALKVAESVNDKGRISACYNNIGTVYQIQENYEKALPYFKKSLELEEILENPLQKSIRLYNIGEVYREMDSLTLALSNFTSSLIIEKKFDNDEGVVYALLGISDIYLKLGRPSDANLSLDEAEQLMNNANVETNILYNLHRSEAHFQQKELKTAREFIKEAKNIAKENDFRIYRIDIYEQEIAIQSALDKQGEPKAENLDSKKKSVTSNLWYIVLLAVVIGVLYIVYSRSKRKDSIQNLKDVKIDSESPVDSALIFELKNSKGKQLFSGVVSQILCFEANDNYVIVHYLKDETPAKTMERITLRKIEDQLSEIGITFSRVHKSFLINPDYVEGVSGKSQAYKIQLQHLKTEVPVSRKFDISAFK